MIKYNSMVKICKSIVLIVFLVLISLNLSAQKRGVLFGRVIDAKTKETLPGAAVYVTNNNQVGTITDLDGDYRLELPEGVYDITISFISYNEVKLSGIRIEGNKNREQNVDMVEAAIGLQLVEVTATRRSNSEMAMISSIKTNVQVSNGVSSQMISKTQDRDAGEVVKRIPGVTVMGDKFVVIRGLNQRYNNVWLNNAVAPSSEADQRAFSFDMIPSNLIENITVFKAATADLSADFSGGFIKIFTKSMPDDDVNMVSYTVGVKTGTTFSDFKMNAGSATDFLGFDDGKRAIPKGVPEDLNPNVFSKGELVGYSKLFNDDWNLKSRTAIPDQRLQVNIARKIKGKKFDLGTVNSINYGYSFDSDRVSNRSYQTYNIEGDKSVMNFDYDDKTYSETARLGLMSNWTFLVDSKNKVEFRNLFNQIGQKGALERYGWDYYGGNYKNSQELSYMSRSIYSGQVTGEHTLADNSVLDWIGGFSYANRNEPDIKRMTYLLDTDEASDLYGRYIAVITQQASVNTAGRLFTYLNEYVENAAVNYTKGFRDGKDFQPQLKVGMFAERKDRDFRTRLLGWRKANYYQFDNSLLWEYGNENTDGMFQESNINTTTGFLMEETTSPSDSYKGSNTLGSAYGMVNLPYKGWNFNFGVRFEYNSQIIHGFDLRNRPIDITKNKADLFPSFNVTYEINKKNQLRVAYARNINRPEFRELAPYWFYSFEEAAGYTGNPNLKDAYIDNVEIRYEFYPTMSQIVTVGVFYKNFKDPIELKLSPTGSNMEYTFTNAKGAYSVGAEVDIKKSLDFMKMKNLYLVLNAAYIKTQVTYQESDIQRPRPLQGQSPYIVNAGLFYQSVKLGLSASLVYNVIGKRIIAIGEPAQNQNEDIPDIYELSRNLLDFTISKKIGRFVELRFGARDLICNDVVTAQFVKFTDSNGVKQTREQVNRVYNPGRQFSLGAIVSF